MNVFIKTLLLLLLLSASPVTYAQYVIIDRDGYANVREKPSSKSKIVGKMHRGQIFDTPENSICGFGDTYPEQYEAIEWSNPDWMPVLLTEVPLKFGYIYRKNSNSLHDLEKLAVKSESDSTITFFDAEVEVMLATKPFDTLAANVTKEGGFWKIDGEYPIGVDAVMRDSVIVQLKEVTVKYMGNAKENRVPQKELSMLVLKNPFGFICTEVIGTTKIGYRNTTVRKGVCNDLYITISGGDAASSFSITWIFVDGIFKQQENSFGC